MSLIILEGKVNVASLPNPPIGSLLLAHDLDGTLKQKNDAGIVSSVSGSLPLSSILSIGNSTGTSSIILNSGSAIKGQVGTSELKLDGGNVFLSTDGTTLTDTYLFMGPGGNVVLNAVGRGNLSLNNSNSAKLSWVNPTINSLSVGSSSFIVTSNGKDVINIGNNILSGGGSKLPTIISSDGSTIASGIVNTVVLGGTTITATVSNALYADSIYLKGIIKQQQGSAYIGSNNSGESFLYSEFGSIGIVTSVNKQNLSNGVLIYDTTSPTNTPNIDSNIVYVGSKNSTSSSNVRNSVVIGGIAMVAINSNTVYLGNTVNINNRYTLPSVDGVNGQLLKTDGSGNVSWGTIDNTYLTLAGLTVSGVANFTTLNFSYLTLVGLTVSGTSSFNTASFNRLSVPYLDITGITANNGRFNTLGATSASFSTIYANTLNVSTLLSDNGVFVSNLMASVATFSTITATSASFSSIFTPSLNVNTLNATNGIFSTLASTNASFGNIIVPSMSISGLTVSASAIITGTISINKLGSAPSNNNATKLLGLSGSQLVEVNSFVNSVTSSNSSIKVSATGSNFTYDFTLGFTSSTNTIQIASTGPGTYNLQIATDSKATSGSNNFMRSGELYNELLLKQNLPTGYVSGLTLSITPGDNTKFNISYGGFLVTDYTDVFNVVSTIVQLPIAGLTGISPIGLTSTAATYIALDKNMNVIQSLIPFNDVDRRTLCLVGAVIHSNLTVINTTNRIVAPIIAPTNQLHDLIKAIGFMNLTGNAYSPINAATSSDLTMKKSAGEIWGLGINGADYTDPHKLVIPAQATFSFRIRKSTTPITETADLVTLVGNLNYETIISSTNSTLTAIPSNRFGVFHGTLFQSGLTRFQYPQRIYTSLTDAVNSSHTEDYTIESNIRDNGIFRFYLIIQGGTTNFSDPARYQFVEVGKFGNVSSSGGSSLTFANLISTLGYTPENVINKQNSLTTDGTGQKYPTIDAVNSGFAIKKQGSYIYSASQSTISHTGGTNSTLLTNTGNGTFSVSYPPTGLTAGVWIPGTNRFNFSEMSLGDMVNIQVDMNIITSTTDQEIELYLVLAEGTPSEYQLAYANSGLLKRNATYPFITNNGILINTSAVRNNPAKLIFKSSANATIDIKGWYITVHRY